MLNTPSPKEKKVNVGVKMSKAVLFLESSPFLPSPGQCSISPQHRLSPLHSNDSGW